MFECRLLQKSGQFFTNSNKNYCFPLTFQMICIENKYNTIFLTLITTPVQNTS
jgi:hypothetical protein